MYIYLVQFLFCQTQESIKCNLVFLDSAGKQDYFWTVWITTVLHQLSHDRHRGLIFRHNKNNIGEERKRFSLWTFNKINYRQV